MTTMKTLLSSAAFVALLAGAPAFAEDPAPAPAPAAEQQAPAAVQPTDPAAPKADGQSLPDTGAAAQPATPADPSAKPMPDTAQTPAATDQPAVAATGDVKFLGEQAADQQLASSWIGKTVYSSTDENLGDINDLVIGKNGQVDAVVLGVGGFLGIGEKSVAVPFNAIQATADENGAVKLTFNATKEQLDAAPDFMTLADQKAKAQAEAPAAEAPSAPATPAPAQ